VKIESETPTKTPSKKKSTENEEVTETGNVTSDSAKGARGQKKLSDMLPFHEDKVRYI
jgi:hypothetical protein